MRTKHLLVILAAIVFAFTTGYSQKQHGRLDLQGRIEDRLDKMDKVVKFTGDQRAQVKALFDEMANKKKDAFCANEMGSDGMQKAMKSIHKDKDARLKKILTKDQMTLWKDHIKDLKADHSTNTQGRKGKQDGKGKSMDDRINTRLDKMNEVVKFTGTQREDLKRLFTDLAKRGKDVICANEIGSDALKAEMKKLNEERRDGMKKILTEDQQKLWKDHKKSMHDQRKKDPSIKTQDGEKKGTDTREK